ncbi:MAG: hypothetical protein O7B99_02755 [Planctomycetota bacterium]|nr:hypothetical protein [Planctomycetota bacterium]
MKLRLLAVPLAASLILAQSSCTIVSVGSEDSPPRIESRGLIESHVAVGIRDEDHLLHARVFNGHSPGSIGELVIWRLFRLEVGLAGAAIGVGPLDIALGVLFYDPQVPDTIGERDHDDHDEHDHDYDDEDEDGQGYGAGR